MSVAQQLDPLTSVIPSNLGWAYHSSGRQEEAIAAFRAASDFNPRFPHAHEGMGSALIELRRYAEAVPEFEKAVELAKGQRTTRAYLARGYALAGRRSEAEKIFGELRSAAQAGNGSPWGVALVAISLRDKEEAMRWLELGYQRRDFPMVYLKIDPAFRGLRADPRFVSLLGRMGL
jgi:Flp pilus assembly protein TadD